MCIGIPMQVVETGPGRAICEGMGQRREVDTLLVGDQPAGTWLLIFLNSARDVLTPQDAERIGRAVEAVDLVMQQGGRVSPGGLPESTIESLFADLIGREPEKPPSLLALEAERKRQETST